MIAHRTTIVASEAITRSITHTAAVAACSAFLSTTWKKHYIRPRPGRKSRNCLKHPHQCVLSCHCSSRCCACYWWCCGSRWCCENRCESPGPSAGTKVSDCRIDAKEKWLTLKRTRVFETCYSTQSRSSLYTIARAPSLRHGMCMGSTKQQKHKELLDYGGGTAPSQRNSINCSEGHSACAFGVESLSSPPGMVIPSCCIRKVQVTVPKTSVPGAAKAPHVDE
ncbi:hypothetical protein R3P38DRAFT_2979852 [Favolaschia claudopus]|uniref:Uncharacterized protein n=1 Tax=Favolaschia claudopus TaxID=2862362 RepID=A0AAW0B011_9AGAR